MKRKRWLFLVHLVCWVAIPVIFIHCGRSREVSAHHALTIIGHYLPLEKGTHLVIPYQVNVLALNLLLEDNMSTRGSDKTTPQKNIINQCQQYIQWYLNHINTSDTFGLTGTIYTYQVDAEGGEQFQKDMEFTDRTAATFILLLHRFYQVTGYRQMISQSREKIEHIAYLIPHLQDEVDGLIRTLPVGNQKLLENNCLAYAAMDAFVQLAHQFQWSKPDFYQEVRDDIRGAVREYFYRPNHGEFYWQITGSGDKSKRFALDWNTFYPDSVAQLFPLLYGLLPPEEQNNQNQLWQKFRDRHGNRWAKTDKTIETILQHIIYKWTYQAMSPK